MPSSSVKKMTIASAMFEKRPIWKMLDESSTRVSTSYEVNTAPSEESSNMRVFL